jgi:hypothetical protein
MSKNRKVKDLTQLIKKNSSELVNNPFVSEDFIISVRKITVEKCYKLDKEGLLLPVERELEQDNNIKIYTKFEHRIILSEMSSKGQRLFLHILYELEYGVDYIALNKGRYMSENKISSINTYKESIRELTVNLVIIESTIKGVFWINPRFFFAGSRIKKYPKNWVIK